MSVSFGVVSQEPLDSPLEPQQVFARMIEANRDLAYSGLLAYERAGQLATYKIESQIEGDGSQSLSSLNRALPIQTHSLLCQDSQEQSTSALQNLENLYNFYRPAESMVAGRETMELLMLPVDGNRYGYGFSVDRENYLPLRTVVLTPRREPLERYEFVAIEFLELPPSQAQVLGDCPELENQPLSWSAEVLPRGFVTTRSGFDPETNVSHMVVSDGLATISISIEPIEAPSFPPVTTDLGATNILLSYLSYRQQIYLATLVGEVPLESLEQIVTGLNYKVNDAESER